MADWQQVPDTISATPPAPLQIRLLRPQDLARWDAFVLACPGATFFHRAGWQTVIEQAFGHRTWFLYAERGPRIVAVLPLANVRSRLFGNSLCSLPFCVYGGIAGGELDDEARQALDDAAQDLARELRVDHLEYRNRDHGHADWPSSALYVTFRKVLASQAEQNMLEIPRKQRAMVRKGIACGLHGVAEDQTGAFFHAYARSVHRLGTPVFAQRYFDLLLSEFGPDCEIVSIYRDSSESQVIASVLVFYFRDEVLPYYGGGTDAARQLAGNDFMYWEVMRRACQRGCTVFDFGRSKVGTGAFDFKKNWGFSATPLHYSYKLREGKSLPDTNPLNPKYRLLIKAWQRLPLSVANLIGPHLVRQLG